jgi:tripartite-type tricarboxylate transporter receptor subunit TctC
MFKKLIFIAGMILSIGSWANSTVPPMPPELVDKTIKVIICRAPGAQTDVTQRFILEQVKQLTGLKFTVVNQAGAQGLIAARDVVNSAPNGLTVFAGDNTNHVVNPVIPLDGVVPVDMNLLPAIAIHAFSPQFFYVSAKSNIYTLDDLANAAKKNKRFNAGYPTVHSMLIQSEFFAKNGVDNVNFVPYTRSTEMPIQIELGDLDVYLSAGADNKPFVDKGILRAVGTSWNHSLPIYPNAQPIATHIPGFKSNQQQLIAVHQDTPKHIKEYYNKVFRIAANTVESQERWKTFSLMSGHDLDINAVQKVIEQERDATRRMHDRIQKLKKD